MIDSTDIQTVTPPDGERGGSTTSTEAAVSGPSRAVIRGADGRFVAGSGRPPKRRPGGALGNLNASRHPWRSLWKRGTVRPEHRAIVAAVMNSYEAEMGAHLGGEGEETYPERRLVAIAATAAACAALIVAEVGKAGPFTFAKGTGGLGLAPALAELPKFLLIESKTLQALGLERRSRPVNPLDAVRAAVAEANQR